MIAADAEAMHSERRLAAEREHGQWSLSGLATRHARRLAAIFSIRNPAQF